MDDAYVYFRYVDNLVIHEAGLVYNPGEFVEGFSSPLWALVLIVMRYLRFNYWHIIRIFGMLSYAAFWYIACILNRQLMAEDRRQTTSLNTPLVYLTCMYGVLCYFTSGLESPMVLVMAAAYAALFVLPSSLPLQLLVGLSPLVRHELAVPYAITLGFLWWKTKKFPFVMMFSCALTLGAYMMIRIWYYADVFPNAFYLKDEIWPAQGINYVYDAVVPYLTAPYLLSAVVLFVILRRTHTNEQLQAVERLFMCLSALPVLLYVIKIGGGPRHFRYLAFPFCLTVFATGGLVERACGEFLLRQRRYAYALTLAFALAIALCYPRQLMQHPFFGSYFGFSHREFLLINDAAAHRFHYSGITPSLWSPGRELSYGASEDRYERTTNDGEILCNSWCQTLYLRPRNPAIHTLGLTDPFLARARVASDRPAHKKDLIPMAEHIREIRVRYGFAPGAFDKAIEDSLDIPWIKPNIHRLREIEGKAYHQHHFFDNLLVALSGSDEYDPDSRE
jgi:hypothetical protein